MNSKRKFKYTLIVIVGLLFSIQAISQENITISGYVSDKTTGERLNGATVFAPALNIGTSCNDYGFFSLRIPTKETKIIFRFVGFEIQEINLESTPTTLFSQMAENLVFSEFDK
jgi:hypothetical protein